MTAGAGERPVAIVSGATYGIGRGIALRLADEGWAVVAFGLDAPQLGSAAAGGLAVTRRELAEWDAVPLVLEADVADPAAVAEVVGVALERFGRIDGLVNNAAIRPRGDILAAGLDEWHRTIGVNLTGVFVLSKAVLPTMVDAGRGAIVNVGSASGWGRPGLAVYSASKAGVLGLSQAMAYDLAPHGIRVNTVIPGGVRTGMIEDMESGGHRFPPDRFPVAPADVGDAVAWLLSERAAQVTGAVLNVGGFAGQGGNAGPTFLGRPPPVSRR